MQLPTVHQWNLSIQRELPWGMVMEAGYIGRRGQTLFMAYNINQINSDQFLLPSESCSSAAIAGCRPSGTTSAGVACGTVPPLRAQLIAGGLSATAADANVLNAAATLTDLQFNAAGAFAERIENNTLALRLRPNQQFGSYLSRQQR